MGVARPRRQPRRGARLGWVALLLLSSVVIGAQQVHARWGRVTISGRVRDAVSGVAIAGARVKLAGIRATRTDGDGAFSLSTDRLGLLRTTVRHSGYYPRRTYLSLDGSGLDVDARLLPRDGTFDLEFYDHVFRGVARRGTELWTDPTIDVEIWSQAYEYDPARAVYEVVEQPSPDFVADARDVLERELTRLTGGRVQPGRIAVVAHTVGATVPLAQMRPAGVLRIAVAFNPIRPPFSLIYSGCGGAEPCEGIIDIHPTHSRGRAMVLHELGHVLGWDHPRGREVLPLASIMGPTPEPDYPTAADLLYGPILYTRPNGSRSPDNDPKPEIGRRLRRYRSIVDPVVRTPRAAESSADG